ncbi:MAG: hypothetical protein ACREOZ_03520 [Gloeomargaritales cyanobacterium]
MGYHSPELLLHISFITYNKMWPAARDAKGIKSKGNATHVMSHVTRTTGLHLYIPPGLHHTNGKVPGTCDENMHGSKRSVP